MPSRVVLRRWLVDCHAGTVQCGQLLPNEFVIGDSAAVRSWIFLPSRLIVGAAVCMQCRKFLQLDRIVVLRHAGAVSGWILLRGWRVECHAERVRAGYVLSVGLVGKQCAVRRWLRMRDANVAGSLQQWKLLPRGNDCAIGMPGRLILLAQRRVHLPMQ